MNFLDFFILIYLGAGLWDGYRRGFFQGLANLLGFVLGFLIALFYYHSFAISVIVPLFKVSEGLGELISFLVLIGGIAAFISTLGTYLINRYEEPSLVKFDKIAGSVLGFFTSLVTIGIFLLLLSLLPQNYGLGPILESSKLSSPIIKTISGFYEKVGDKIVSRLPQLINYTEQNFQPGEYQLFINQISDQEWRELDGAVCFNCGGQVSYEGLRKHLVEGEEVVSPYFVCQKCGRHSDSCQTFEGYHKLYGRCPVLLAKQGYRFDCGMWPNGNFVRPKGTCPIDGNVAEEEHNHEHQPILVIKLSL